MIVFPSFSEQILRPKEKQWNFPPYRASYVLFNEAASLHLVRFTAGLDAEVIGDRRAVQAVKKSFDSLEGYSDEKSSLRRFFGFALRTAKKVRVEAGVAKNGMTEPAAAVDEADENAIEFLGKELKDCNVSLPNALVPCHGRDQHCPIR